MKHFLLFLFLFPALVFAQPKSDNFSQPSFRVGAQVGYGHKTALIPAESSAAMAEHLRKLSHNISYGVDFSYYFKSSFEFINNNLGVGLKYNANQTKVQTENVPLLKDNGALFYGTLLERYRVDYIGPFLGVRSFMGKNRHLAFGHFGFGLVKYRNNAQVGFEEFLLKGQAIAFSADIGYDFFVTQNFAIGLIASLTLGNVEYKTDNLKNLRSGKENVTHVDIALGFRFYK